MYALAIHGGAGDLPRARFTTARERAYRHGLGEALAAGQRLLEHGGCALDAVQPAVTVLEDDPLFNAGRGAVLSTDGTAELDAAIMDGTDLRAGAVASCTTSGTRCCWRAQYSRMPRTYSWSATAPSASPRQAGLALVDNEYFITPDRRVQLEGLKLRQSQADSSGSAPLLPLDEPPLGTVGAVARDAAGRLAAATSTGGMAGKRSGRVGDSPVIGAGTYADNDTCAVSTTGHGEWFLRTVQAYDISARLRYGGYSLANAVSEAIVQRLSGLGAAGGLIAVDRQGEIVMRFNTPVMFRASVRAGEAASVQIY